MIQQIPMVNPVPVALPSLKEASMSVSYANVILSPLHIGTAYPTARVQSALIWAVDLHPAPRKKPS